MEHLNPRTESRPWGEFCEFIHNYSGSTTVKIITVKEGGSTSLQKHKHRDEFWRVISGNPEIIIGDSVTEAKKGDEFIVKAETNHRITAKDGDVEILELAFGQFDEEDIIRLEDKYGRS